MLVFFSGRRSEAPGIGMRLPSGLGAVGEEMAGRCRTGAVIYHARNVKDEDEVISFGIFPWSARARVMRSAATRSRAKRQEAIAEHVRRRARSRGSTRWSRRSGRRAPHG